MEARNSKLEIRSAKMGVRVGSFQFRFPVFRRFLTSGFWLLTPDFCLSKVISFHGMPAVYRSFSSLFELGTCAW